MDGLRTLRNHSELGTEGKGPCWLIPTCHCRRHWDAIGMSIVPPTIAQIWPNPRKAGAQSQQSEEVPASLLPDFFELGYTSSKLTPPQSKPSDYSQTGVKIALLQTGKHEAFDKWCKYRNTPWTGTQIMNIDWKDFENLWRALDPHPRLGLMASWGVRQGHEIYGRTADTEGVSGYFATDLVQFIWSIRQHKQSSNFDVRCILLSNLAEKLGNLEIKPARAGHFPKMGDKVRMRAGHFRNMDKLRMANRTNLNHMQYELFMARMKIYHSPEQRAVAHLEAFKDDSHSPLYLPFAMSAYALEECGETIGLANLSVMTWLRGVESERRANAEETSEQKLERHEIDRKFMLEFTQQDILLRLESAKMALKTIESLWRDLVIMEKELPDTAKSEDVCRSNKSILTAICQLQRELEGYREVLIFVETRINSYLSMRAHYLNQTDAIRNTQMAETTYQLAQAARQDSSAMKTIAVLTMAFLPATFLSTLFSMPSLNWDQRRHFVVYWIIAIPLTVATFILWAIVINRRRVQRCLLDIGSLLRSWLMASYAVLLRLAMVVYTPLHNKYESRMDELEARREIDHLYRNQQWKEEMMSSRSSDT